MHDTFADAHTCLLTSTDYPKWPGIADGGAVLDANVPNGLISETHVNGDARICALWDAVNADVETKAHGEAWWRRWRKGIW